MLIHSRVFIIILYQHENILIVLVDMIRIIFYGQEYMGVNKDENHGIQILIYMFLT